MKIELDAILPFCGEFLLVAGEEVLAEVGIRCGRCFGVQCFVVQ
jgi:hypothetical protein